jgi:ABC-type sugar transport system ATPase subunit
MDVQKTPYVLQRIQIFGGVRQKRARRISSHYVEALFVTQFKLTVRNLSGGNQRSFSQMAQYRQMLIMDEPTRGIDIGAKAEVHALMSQLAKRGIGILMISSEMPEIIGMSDRVIVMCQGRITGEFERGQLDQEEIMMCATQFLTVEGEGSAETSAVSESVAIMEDR